MLQTIIIAGKYTIPFISAEFNKKKRMFAVGEPQSPWVSGQFSMLWSVIEGERRDFGAIRIDPKLDANDQGSA